MSISGRIKEIREQIGMTQQELATRTGINRSTIAQIENGKSKDFSISKLISISNALNTPVSYLYEAEQDSAEKRILYRAKKRLTPENIPEIFWIVHSLYSRYKTLSDITNLINIGYIIPYYHVPFEPIYRRNRIIISIAEKERNSIGIQAGQNYDLKKVLSKYADIFEIPFSSFDILGFTIFIDISHRPLIVINSLINPSQKRFIIAHEYGHLLFDQGKISDLIELKIDWNSTDPIEVRANQFAAEFLLPKRDILQYSDKVNEAGLAFLMNKYGVSRQVIVNRWSDLDLIDQSQKEYFDNIKPIQLMKLYGYDNDEIRYYSERILVKENVNDFDKLPLDYLQLVKAAYITGKISYKKIAYYSFIQPDEIEQKLEIKEEESNELEYSYV